MTTAVKNRAGGIKTDSPMYLSKKNIAFSHFLKSEKYSLADNNRISKILDAFYKIPTLFIE